MVQRHEGRRPARASRWMGASAAVLVATLTGPALLPACGGDEAVAGSVDTDEVGVVSDADTGGPEDTEVVEDDVDDTGGAGASDTMDAVEDSESDTADAAPAPLTLTRLRFEASASNPLAGRFSATTDRAARVAVTVTGPDGVPADVPGPAGDEREHRRWVLGLWPAATFTFDVVATAADGAVASASLSATTPTAAGYLPRYTRVAGDDAAISSGLTLTQPQSAGAGGPRGLLVVIDAQARIRWVYAQDQPIRAARFTPRGTFYVADRSGITERDVAGRTLRYVERTALGADTLHHALLELPDGHVLVLSTELRVIGGYPEDTPGGAAQNVVGDVVIDVAPDGAVTRWALLDLLDPHRVAHGFFVDGYDAVYGDAAPTRDWSHANALAWDPARQAVLVCLRHQHQVVALDRASGAVVWALGDGGDFALTAPGAWFHGPHAAKPTPDGGVILFDNGFGRPGAEGGNASRALELALNDSGDASGWTAEVAWQWWGDAPFFSPAMGDADLLPNGDVLVTISSLPSAETQRNYARIVEVTHTAAPEVVWDVTVDHPSAGYQVYQSDRLAALYPPELLAP